MAYKPILLDHRSIEDFHIHRDIQRSQKKSGFMGDEYDVLEDYRFEVVSGTVILPVYGYICHRGYWGFYGMSCEGLMDILGKLSRIEKIKRIILKINSPGGEVSGVQQVADYIYSLRSVKPIYAYVDSLAASAAYWIAAACRRVYVSEDSAEVGSIGVILLHLSEQKWLDHLGMKVTHIQAGKHKSVGSPFKDLSDEDKAILQKDVDLIYNTFVESISKFRGMSAEEVKSTEALTFMPKEAKNKKLIDGKFSISELAAQLAEEEEEEKNAEEEDEDPEAADDDNEEEAMDDDEDPEAAEEDEEPEAADDDNEEEAMDDDEEAEEDEKKKKGRKASRIKRIRAITMPGFEKFMAKFIKDCTTSPEEAFAAQKREATRRRNVSRLAGKHRPVTTSRSDRYATSAKDKLAKQVEALVPDSKKKKAEDKTVGEYLARR